MHRIGLLTIQYFRKNNSWNWIW